MAKTKDESLTGVWHGLYSYPAHHAAVYFVATLIQSGSTLSGTIHESEKGEHGAPLTLFASVRGSTAGTAVGFDKTYDGTGGWSHTVVYKGTLNGDATEIEGTWTIAGAFSGKFLMIRSRHATEAAARRAFAKV